MANTMNQIGTQQKKRVSAPVNDNMLESLRGIGANVGQTLLKDVVSRIGSDILTSFVAPIPRSGELKPDIPLDFTAEQKPHIQIRHQDTLEPFRRQEQEFVKKHVEAIQQELKTLSKSLKGLNIGVQKAISEIPVQPGIYHISFFEQLKTVLLSLREHVDNSQIWLRAFNSRKNKRKFWGMYKKHGTSFGLSSERTADMSAG